LRGGKQGWKPGAHSDEGDLASGPSGLVVGWATDHILTGSTVCSYGPDCGRGPDLVYLFKFSNSFPINKIALK
jgi:hypothetical protein